MTSPPPREATSAHGESINRGGAADDAQRAGGSVRRILRRRDAIGIIVGIVIGAGIYRAPPTVAGTTGDVGWLLVAWLLGGLISFAGALCYAELATKYPHAGGDYHFLTRAFGRRTSFLYAWARATVINPGAIALLAFVFGDYMASAMPAGPGTATWAIAIVVLLTVVNVVGSSQFPGGGDPPLSVRGGVTTPGVRTYQIWYRNAAVFCTPATFNLSNGYQITWTP